METLTKKGSAVQKRTSRSNGHSLTYWELLRLRSLLVSYLQVHGNKALSQELSSFTLAKLTGLISSRKSQGQLVLTCRLTCGPLVASKVESAGKKPRSNSSKLGTAKAVHRYPLFRDLPTTQPDDILMPRNYVSSAAAPEATLT